MIKKFFASLFALAFLAGSTFAADSTIRIQVPDMSCEGCASTVTKALTKLEGVKGAHVDPVAKIALVDVKPKSELTDATLQKAIKDAGYSAKKIERLPIAFAKAKAELAKKAG